MPRNKSLGGNPWRTKASLRSLYCQIHWGILLEAVVLAAAAQFNAGGVDIHASLAMFKL